MALRKKRIPRYGTVQVNGHKYYRTDVEDAEGISMPKAAGFLKRTNRR